MKPFFTEADCDMELKPPMRYQTWSGPVGKFLSVSQANHLLEERGKVVSCRFNDLHLIQAMQSNDNIFYPTNTHTALIINIEPIDQDSAEEILKAITKLDNYHTLMSDIRNLSARAKALLAKEKK